MTQPHPAPSAPARWTPARQRLFLSALMNLGSVTQAAHTVGMSRSSANRLRRRLAGTPFDQAWDKALHFHALQMRDPMGVAARNRPRHAPDASAARGGSVNGA